ncbi:MAG TPA: hypothetical protein PLP17_09185, partial [Oligoflexia bacterium]|nr:hypothetical protein [Oligoflexia bacterium]
MLQSKLHYHGSMMLVLFLVFPALLQAETNCAKLSREQCLASRKCAIDFCSAEQRESASSQLCYTCRPRTQECEVGFSHLDAEKRRAECEQRPGCAVRLD